ncbi:MAG: glycyl-radical enzyme activating protein [Coprobacillaceae bacterium]
MEISNKGLVFSIKRFAIHDGQGIRTTIFLKGCNLRCVWCHNPEGLELQSQIIVNHKKCIYCHRCIGIDKKQVMIDTGTTMNIKNQDGMKYQEYIDICPTGAIQWDSTYYSVEQLMEELLKDKVFFKHGGGVTISGGEPLLQIDFVVMLLKACKELNIHTAIETALHIPLSNIQKVLPYVDTIYCDIKEIDNTLHQQFTKVRNIMILDNIKYLLTSNDAYKVIIRTPLIPRHTASKGNIIGIAKFIKKYNPNVFYELLNYNPLAVSKYLDLKQAFCLDINVPKYTLEEMEQYKLLVKEQGLKNVI